MGKRLTKIVTRTGDDGTTGLGDGSRTGKDSLRIGAIGDVDELNSQLGLLLTEDLPEAVRGALLQVQHDLFDLGGELSIPGYPLLKEAHVIRLDEWLAHYNADLPRLPSSSCRAAAGARPRPTSAVPSAAGRSAAGRPRCRRGAQRCAAPLPEPPVGPAVRAGPRAQPVRRRQRRAVAARPG